MMTKCEFCKVSDPNGKCYWGTGNNPAREDDCKKAIKNMVKAMSLNNENKNKCKRIF